MGDELRFDDRVAIVTGAGGGLGRCHALLLASRGAKVVVNDLGGGIHGGGKGSAMADQVVAEIREAGGEAVANYDSVEDGAKIVETALDTWGRIDIVVNNAGILRDTSFHKMSEEDWDLIYRVHVLGSFRVTHAAWPHMREAGYGRIVMTASAAGIYGNFGQANYGMAKLGLLGFSNTLAIEGRKRGIQVNTIAPLAGSRLTETVLPPELLAALKPEYVSPLVAWLCHEKCEETGGLFEVGGGYFGKLRWERALGQIYRLGRNITPDDIQRGWAKVTGFEESEHPGSVNESFGPIMENIQKGPSKGGNDLIDVDAALGWKYPKLTSRYDERDLALYALGVGAAEDPYDDDELQVVYEMHGKGFKALPTYAVVPAVNVVIEQAKQGKTPPGMNYGFERILHGEQYTEVKRPLPPNGKLTHEARIKDIFDKGKGALVITAIDTFDETGELLAYNELTMYVRGAGGWGGDRGPSAEVNVPPDREPDAVVEEQVPVNQALLYRLSGDINPLHVDPAFAGAFGFEKPILHGLCTFGYAGRHVIKSFSGGDPRFFKSIKVRFAESVFPGETLVTQMWKESDTKIVFRTRVKERDVDVITNAAIELYTEIPKPKPKAAPKPAAAAAAPSKPITADIFAAIGAHIAGTPGLTDKVGKVFQFKLTSPDSVWTVDVKAGGVGEGETAKPDCTLELTDHDFMGMCTGELDAQKLYFSGDLKISGDVMASQKLSFLQKMDPQLVVDAMNARAGGAGGEGGAAEPAPAAAEPGSEDVFLGIRAYVEANPELSDKVATSFLFKLTGPESAWTVDLTQKPGQVLAGEHGKPDCTLELSDDNFMAMTSGKADPQKLYFAGDLKISGNVMASQKLTFLQKIDPEWAREQVAKMKASGAAEASTGAAAAAPAKQAKAPAIFEALTKRIAETPALVQEVQAVIGFSITGPDAAWTVDLKTGSGSVTAGETKGADTVLTLDDDSLAALVSGEATPQDLHQRGALRVDGDVRPAQRLGFLKQLV